MSRRIEARQNARKFMRVMIAMVWERNMSQVSFSCNGVASQAVSKYFVQMRTLSLTPSAIVLPVGAIIVR